MMAHAVSITSTEYLFIISWIYPFVVSGMIMITDKVLQLSALMTVLERRGILPALVQHMWHIKQIKQIQQL